MEHSLPAQCSVCTGHKTPISTNNRRQLSLRTYRFLVETFNVTSVELELGMTRTVASLSIWGMSGKTLTASRESVVVASKLVCSSTSMCPVVGGIRGKISAQTRGNDVCAFVIPTARIRSEDYGTHHRWSISNTHAYGQRPSRTNICVGKQRGPRLLPISQTRGTDTECERPERSNTVRRSRSRYVRHLVVALRFGICGHVLTDASRCPNIVL